MNPSHLDAIFANADNLDFGSQSFLDSLRANDLTSYQLPNSFGRSSSTLLSATQDIPPNDFDGGRNTNILEQRVKLAHSSLINTIKLLKRLTLLLLASTGRATKLFYQ
jgi:hypothetical protein